MANHHQRLRTRKDDPFFLNYNATDLQIASEFVSNSSPVAFAVAAHKPSPIAFDPSTPVRLMV